MISIASEGIKRGQQLACATYARCILHGTMARLLYGVSCGRSRTVKRKAARRSHRLPAPRGRQRRDARPKDVAFPLYR